MECNKLDLTDIVIYNILVEGLCIGQIFESALDLFCGPSAKRLEADVRTHNMMINGLCHHK